jgi:hypothetical protein
MQRLLHELWGRSGAAVADFLQIGDRSGSELGRIGLHRVSVAGNPCAGVHPRVGREGNWWAARDSDPETIR